MQTRRARTTPVVSALPWRLPRPFPRLWTALLLLACPLQAQWVTQPLDLVAGRNVVFLHVQPEPRDCDLVFTNTPVESVRQWNRKRGWLEFDVDPGRPFPQPGDWTDWYPAGSTNRSLITFTDLLAGEAYSIQVAAGAGRTRIGLKGRPRLHAYAWYGQAFSLVGLPVPVDSPPRFLDFFKYTDAIKTLVTDGAQIYQVEPDSTETRIIQPHITTVTRGRAYWILSSKVSDYAGPLSVRLEDARAEMDFGRSLSPRVLRVRNVASTTRALVLRHVASEAAPPGATPVAGEVPLVYSILGPGENTSTTTYASLPGAGLVTNLAPQQEVRVAFRPVSTNAPGTYQSILEVRDQPATGPPGVEWHQIGLRYEVPPAGTDNPAGLWVGTVTVQGVNRAKMGPNSSQWTGTNSEPWDVARIQPVNQPFTFRVILDVGSSNSVRLLSRALVAWVPTEERVIAGMDQPYTFGTAIVLESEDAALDFAGQHPNATIRRLGSINFPLEPAAWTNSGGAFGVTNQFTIPMNHNNRVNPFYHPYHPMHDSLQGTNALGDGIETYGVKRTLTFEFQNEPLAGESALDWGVRRCGGTYRESVVGLHGPVLAEGTFVLEKVVSRPSP